MEISDWVPFLTMVLGLYCCAVIQLCRVTLAERKVHTRELPRSMFNNYDIGLEYYTHCPHYTDTLSRVHRFDFCTLCFSQYPSCTFHNRMCGKCVAVRVYFLQRYWRSQRTHSRKSIKRLHTDYYYVYSGVDPPELSRRVAMCTLKTLRRRLWERYVECALHPDSPYIRRMYVRRGDPPKTPVENLLIDAAWYQFIRAPAASQSLPPQSPAR